MLNFFRITLSTLLYHFAKTITASKIKSQGRIIAASYDFCVVIAAWVLACWVLINGFTELPAFSDLKHIVITLAWIVPPQFILFKLLGLYRGFWRFASIQDLKKILYGSSFGGLITWVILWSHAAENFPIRMTGHLNYAPPHTIAFLYTLFLVALLSSARFFVRFAKDYKHLYGECQRVIIIGAGNAGESLVRDLLRDDSHRYQPVGLIDDDLSKLGREIHGVRVVGTLAQLPSLILKYDIDLALIAIPSASSSSMRSVVEICEKAKVRCYTLPGIKDLANGSVSINVLRRISLEDLLGRYPVPCHWDLIEEHLNNKCILVTGGGGSIGSELCRQIAALGKIASLIIVDSNEYNLYAIDMELRQRFSECQVIPALLSVTDRVGIQHILKKYQPNFVFHAAAYKHVPMLEHQPRAAIYNNIIGTSIVAEEAALNGVEKFVLISSDKAVNPTNIMGASKRAAEYFCQNLNDKAHKTQFITVRFGNVLDSAGSVIPLFRKQIEAGGPITVTHPDITRYFMTIPEASQLILQAGFMGEGGEIFVLDMGDPIKIRYLAEQMVKLAGKTVDKDIKITYTGLRPGEKLYEECFYPSETLQPTTHTKILRAQSQRRNFEEIQKICDQLEDICKKSSNTENELVKLLTILVPEYQIENLNNLLTKSEKHAQIEQISPL